jgi:hypothetical protein
MKALHFAAYQHVFGRNNAKLFGYHFTRKGDDACAGFGLLTQL